MFNCQDESNIIAEDYYSIKGVLALMDGWLAGWLDGFLSVSIVAYATA